MPIVNPTVTLPPVAKTKRTSLILAIVFGVMMLILGGICVWLTVNYLDQKDNVDQKVEAAVVKAVKEREDELERQFLEREKEPMVEFAGPDDLGHLTFSYPKTWSVYVAKSNNPFEAYLNPKQVYPVSNSSRYALRVTIENNNYDTVMARYNNLIKKGDLSSSAVAISKVEEATATRLSGQFNKDIRGSAIIFKLRDKTVTLRTDVDQTFAADFEQLIKTINFNK